MHNHRVGHTHTLSGGIWDGDSTLYLLVDGTVTLLVRKSCLVVTGTGCPGGVVIPRRIDRARGTMAETVGHYFLIDIGGSIDMERLGYVTGKCGEHKHIWHDIILTGDSTGRCWLLGDGWSEGRREFK